MLRVSLKVAFTSFSLFDWPDVFNKSQLEYLELHVWFFLFKFLLAWYLKMCTNTFSEHSHFLIFLERGGGIMVVVIFFNVIKTSITHRYTWRHPLPLKALYVICAQPLGNIAFYDTDIIIQVLIIIIIIWKRIKKSNFVKYLFISLKYICNLTTKFIFLYI